MFPAGRSRVPANISHRPFPRARQHFPPVLAAYKSGQSAPPWTPKTLFSSAAAKTFPPAASNDAHQQQ
jgi:hypothetical protein